MLTSYEDLTPDNIIFNEAKEYKVNDSKIKYKRIPYEVKYPNGKKGPLIIETPFLFSFGVNEKKSQDTNKLVGYSIPVCLWSKDSEPNAEEQLFFEALNNFIIYKQVEYTDKKAKKKTRRDPSAAPVLYAKLIYSEKSKKILSLFRTERKKI